MDELQEGQENLSPNKKLPLEPVQLQPNTSELEALEKVRDILFGKQLEEQQSRLGQVGNELSSEIANLRLQFTNHLNTLESEVATEIKAVRDTITAHVDRQTETERNVRDAINAVNERLDVLASEMKGQIESLKSGLNNLSQRTETSTQHLREHLDRVDHLIEDLRHTKVAYTQLAGLFGEAAQKLQQTQQSG